MSLAFFDIERGLRLDDTGAYLIPLPTDPDTGVGDSDEVGKGSIGLVYGNGTIWRKFLDGAGADKWLKLVDTDNLGGIADGSWREPVQCADFTSTLESEVITSLNETNSVGGGIISNGMRVLLATLTDAGGNNVYYAYQDLATLDFGTLSTDQIRLTAKERGPDGNAISIEYTTNTFDDDPVTSSTLTHVDAVASTGVIGTNNSDELALTAVTAGVAGDSITIVYTTNTFDGETETLATVSGTDITVNLANDGVSAITATLDDVVAAVNDSGGPAARLVTATVAAGSTGTNVIASEYTVESLGSGVDLDDLITVHLGNTYDDLTTTGTIIATTNDVWSALVNNPDVTALVEVEILDDGATIDAEYVEENLAGGTVGQAIFPIARIGTTTVDQVNILGRDTDNTRTIEYTTNTFDEATATTVAEAAGVITVSLANARIAATLSIGTPTVDEIDFTAVTPGVEGNNITIAYTTNTFDGATSTTAAAVGNDITVSLANDGASTITGTVQQVVNAINNTGATSALVSAVIGAGVTNTTAIGAEAAAANLTSGESNITATAQDVVDAITNDTLVGDLISASLGYDVVGTTVIGAEYSAESIVGGVDGDWVLVEDTNEETDGDTLWIQEECEAYGGRIYTMEGGIWIQRGAADRTELQYIRNFIGKLNIGSEMPDYSSENWITDGDDLVLAISKLDAEIGANVTGGVYINTGDTINQNIQSLNDALEQVRFVSRTEVPATVPTVVNTDLTLDTLAQKYFVHVRNVSAGVQGHLYIGTQNDDRLYITANEIGSDYNTIDIVYTTNSFDGAATTTTAVTGVLGDDDPVLITVSLANDGASAITATAQDVIDAINLGGSDSAELVTAAIDTGSTAGNTIGSEYTTVNMIEGDDNHNQVNAAEIYVTHDRQIGGDGKMSETEVATDSDHTTYAKLRMNGTIPGLTYSTQLSGAGVNQTVDLVVQANVDTVVHIYRASVNHIDP